MSATDPRLFGSFVPTTNIWDVIQGVEDTNVNSPEFKELLVRMYQNINLMAIVLNTKDTGIYQNQEFVNGQVWFSNPLLTSNTGTVAAPRQVFRMTVNFGALPNTGSKSVAHRIPMTPAVTFTRVYGAASDTSGNNYIGLSYASASGTDNIQLDVNATNVIVTTASNRSNFTVSYIILEYLKN